MCNCNLKEMELLPELESLLIGSSNSYNRRYNSPSISNEWEYEYEAGPQAQKALPAKAGGTGVSTASCLTPAAGLMPRFLDPKLIGCLQIKVPFERTNAIFSKSIQANPNPTWSKRITGDVAKAFPEVKLTIELWHFVPLNSGNWRVILEPLERYLLKKEGPFTVSVLGSLNAKKNF
ncbi:MAG TPA: hypothetical protein VK644_05125, partial [Chitinophagaceae bacterium]|nr:hypothetical protein [Chitinophagaceae bacterium]